MRAASKPRPGESKEEYISRRLHDASPLAGSALAIFEAAREWERAQPAKPGRRPGREVSLEEVDQAVAKASRELRRFPTQEEVYLRLPYRYSERRGFEKVLSDHPGHWRELKERHRRGDLA